MYKHSMRILDGLLILLAIGVSICDIGCSKGKDERPSSSPAAKITIDPLKGWALPNELVIDTNYTTFSSADYYYYHEGGIDSCNLSSDFNGSAYGSRIEAKVSILFKCSAGITGEYSIKKTYDTDACGGFSGGLDGKIASGSLMLVDTGNPQYFELNIRDDKPGKLIITNYDGKEISGSFSFESWDESGKLFGVSVSGNFNNLRSMDAPDAYSKERPKCEHHPFVDKVIAGIHLTKDTADSVSKKFGPGMAEFDHDKMVCCHLKKKGVHLCVGGYEGIVDTVTLSKDAHESGTHEPCIKDVKLVTGKGIELGDPMEKVMRIYEAPEKREDKDGLVVFEYHTYSEIDPDVSLAYDAYLHFKDNKLVKLAIHDGE